MQIPLDIRAVLRLGRSCVANENSLTLHRAQTAGVDLHQIERAPLSKRREYMGGEGKRQYLFLYHACASSSPLHVFAVFSPSGPAKLHLVDPATRRQPISRLQELYSELRRKREGAYGMGRSVKYPSTHEFTTTYHATDVTALKAISREFGLAEDGSFTVVISSSKDQSYFDRNIPKLTKFPVISMPKAKSPHTLDIFPWHTHVAQKMLNRYLSLGPWLDRMNSLAVYYDVPIGHLDGDQPLWLVDIAFARRLHQNDMVLWWSPSDQPDLGGVENDRRSAEEFPRTEFMFPGAYSNVCLEISVRNLAVNSVLQSSVVNELEGSGSTTAFDTVSRTLDEYGKGETQRDLTLAESNMSPQAFSLLRSIVKSWLLDKVQSDAQSPASLAIDHFWRWISSSTACLYDPSIHRFVHGLMRKTFIQMLAEFKRLGSQVIFADFSKVLLATSKPPGTAHAYATYINTAVLSHELFQHMHLTTDKFYDYVVFMDQANMCGIVCEDPLAIDPPEELSVEMRWNIAQFLPPAVQKDFYSVVQYFLLDLFKIRQKTHASSRTPFRALQNGGDAADMNQRTAKQSESEMTQEFIARRLTRKLLKIVGSIVERHRDAVMDHEPDGSFDFPILPGSHLPLSNPPLEFVKFACAIFALAKEFQVEIGLLKRSLLDLVGVREFSDQATFHNPCEPLKLPNVPCRHCDTMRDFDFCRDPELLSHDQRRWFCSGCGGEYDRLAIEFTLIGMLHTIERTFAQQDLKCSKCNQIQGDNVSRYCQCSGTYQLTQSKADIRRRLKTVVNVAVVHNLSRLKVSRIIYLREWRS